MRKNAFHHNKATYIALGIAFILILGAISPQGKTFVNKIGVYLENVSKDEVLTQGKFWLPSGRETYQIAQAEGKHPQIFEATIDPPDVHVGDTQKLSIIVADDAGIESVVAKIETDHSIKELPLKYVRGVSENELLPQKYALDNENRLVIKQDSLWNNFSSLLPFAQAQDAPKLLYEASWKVIDTHSAKYHTTFVAKNMKGEENSITLAWSDPCLIPNSGSWNINTYGNCTISSVNGIDAGNVTITTYTLTLNSTFAFNAANSISITTGAIAMGSGGQIKQTYLWRVDTDADTYPSPSSADQLAQDTDPDGATATWQRKSAFGSAWNNLTDDCYDSNSDANPGQTAFFGVHRGDGDFDYDCSGGLDFYPGIETFSCGAAPPNCDQGPGWQGGPPVDCGLSGTYYNSCNNAGSICNPGSVGGSTLLCR